MINIVVKVRNDYPNGEYASDYNDLEYQLDSWDDLPLILKDIEDCDWGWRVILSMEVL